MTDLADVVELARRERFLVVVSTGRADRSVQSSVVNAGVVSHPVSGAEVVGFVTYGPVKLANLRARPQVAVTVQAGVAWATVEGRAEVIGPDDPHPDLDAEALRRLLRDVFAAAGGTHDDWSAYDSAMAEQRRAAVLILPERIYSN